jgi:lipopolysaccharide export LptBFGC system permease protein LptF
MEKKENKKIQGSQFIRFAGILATMLIFILTIATMSLLQEPGKQILLLVGGILICFATMGLTQRMSKKLKKKEATILAEQENYIQ